jgi:hypothetical protein
VKTTATGASNLKIGAAAIHLAPSIVLTISSANRAQMSNWNCETYKQGVGGEEGLGEAFRIMLDPRERRESHATDCTVQLLYWQSDELIRPSI